MPPRGQNNVKLKLFRCPKQPCAGRSIFTHCGDPTSSAWREFLVSGVQLLLEADVRKPLVPAEVLLAEPTHFTQLTVFSLWVLDE